MPTISTPRKIAGTRKYTRNVIFSGWNSEEREEKVREVMGETGAVLVPPYDHPDVVAGQGTVGVEMEGQVKGMLAVERGRGGKGLEKWRGCSGAMDTAEDGGTGVGAR